MRSIDANMSSLKLCFVFIHFYHPYSALISISCSFGSFLAKDNGVVEVSIVRSSGPTKQGKRIIPTLWRGRNMKLSSESYDFTEDFRNQAEMSFFL